VGKGFKKGPKKTRAGSALERSLHHRAKDSTH
jgi:hypothetical protein